MYAVILYVGDTSSERFQGLLDSIIFNANATDVTEFRKTVYSPLMQSALNTFQKSLFKVFKHFCGAGDEASRKKDTMTSKGNKYSL